MLHLLAPPEHPVQPSPAAPGPAGSQGTARTAPTHLQGTMKNGAKPPFRLHGLVFSAGCARKPMLLAAHVAGGWQERMCCGCR